MSLPGDPESPRSIFASRLQTPSMKPVLLASERENDHRSLQVLLQDTEWNPTRVLSWGEISSCCGCMVSPVVLVDRQFQGSNWRATVSSLFNPGEPLSDFTFGRLRPVPMERIGPARRFRHSHPAFRPLRSARTLALAYQHCVIDWPALQLSKKTLASSGRSSRSR